ncbi:MAG: 3-phosphoshikimate 1-carboxyvinyltransferase [Cyclobacteriaceae bacterium]|nr:3-phosphoshikimate 1-carboxyvinyltransferase [Cyclobacteriaceae bacterium]
MYSGPDLRINLLKEFKSTDIQLPSSKSESNRCLIIQALGGDEVVLENLSSARDTQTMIRLLSSSEDTLDVLDAGTTMRFLTAYMAIKGGAQVLTGTARMQERPIRILVDALRQIGAKIEYLKNDGFPPIRVHGLTEQLSDRVTVPGNVSSQYISALLMIAPYLPKGLTIELSEAISSKPYADMTVKLMQRFGAKVIELENGYEVPHSSYQAGSYAVESDWSAASYWFSWVALNPGSSLLLKGLHEESLQGDRRLVEIYQQLGVRSDFHEEGLVLNHSGQLAEALIYDFSPCPDLFQTVAVTCTLLKVNGQFTGLHSLRVKETDRIVALQNELKKLGALLYEEQKDTFSFDFREDLQPKGDQPVKIETYDDHRMAMAFAPAASFYALVIENGEVVNKSYPEFWEHCRQIGLGIEEID